MTTRQRSHFPGAPGDRDRRGRARRPRLSPSRRAPRRRPSRRVLPSSPRGRPRSRALPIGPAPPAVQAEMPAGMGEAAAGAVWTELPPEGFDDQRRRRPAVEPRKAAPQPLRGGDDRTSARPTAWPTRSPPAAASPPGRSLRFPFLASSASDVEHARRATAADVPGVPARAAVARRPLRRAARRGRGARAQCARRAPRRGGPVVLRAPAERRPLHVRVHRDEEAARSADAQNAHAYALRASRSCSARANTAPTRCGAAAARARADARRPAAAPASGSSATRSSRRRSTSRSSSTATRVHAGGEGARGEGRPRLQRERHRNGAEEDRRADRHALRRLALEPLGQVKFECRSGRSRGSARRTCGGHEGRPSGRQDAAGHRLPRLQARRGDRGAGQVPPGGRREGGTRGQLLVVRQRRRPGLDRRRPDHERERPHAATARPSRRACGMLVETLKAENGTSVKNCILGLGRGRDRGEEHGEDPQAVLRHRRLTHGRVGEPRVQPRMAGGLEVPQGPDRVDDAVQARRRRRPSRRPSRGRRRRPKAPAPTRRGSRRLRRRLPSAEPEEAAA